MLGLLFSACTPPPTPTSTPSAVATILLTPVSGTVLTSTPSPTVQRPNLPATWTPTWTFTPTITPTQTLTPTMTFTASAKDICDNFTVSGPPDNLTLESDSTILFGWHDVPVGVKLLFTITQGQKEVYHLEVPVDGDGIFPFALTELSGSGQFTWKIVLQDPANGDICPHSGTFTRLPFKLM